MRIGIAADHEGFEMKARLAAALAADGHVLSDFGALAETPGDDYPDFAEPLARAVVRGDVERGIAICGSGVGVCVVANKVIGARACVCHDLYSAAQGVEHDEMNVLCLGSKVVADDAALALARAFLAARFTGEERHRRRLAKLVAIEARMGAST